MKSLLLIDYSNTIMRSLAVHQHLAWNGQPTGGLFGFVSQLCSKINRLHPTDFLVCKDKSPYHRTAVYPQYKSDRKKAMNPDWYAAVKTSYAQVDQFLELLFTEPAWEVPGYEADDLIAAAIQHFPQYDKFYVLSNDDDLFQLLDSDRVQLLRKSGTMTEELFRAQYQLLEPKDWIMVTAMAGTHNAVKGIDRCGVKTAIKWVLQFKESGKHHPKVLQNMAIIERNIPLITLPFANEQHPITWCAPQYPHVKARVLLNYLMQHGISYTPSMDLAFSAFF